MTQLTQHFSLEEMIATQHREIDNTPNGEAMINLAYLANALEFVRALLKSPLIISSGYRSPELNKIIGGSTHSQHMLGLAADFTAPNFGNPLAVCKAIINSNIVFDQLIFEHTWTHFGIAEEGQQMRQEVLTYVGPNTYSKGLIEK